MSSLNNGVGNIKGTPAIITDTLANRPSASSLAVGTIFIDRTTGNWYQVGTNNTWSSTGGGGGSATLQTVLDNGNEADNTSLTITNNDNSSFIKLDQHDDFLIKVSSDNGNEKTTIAGSSITCTSNVDSVTTNIYPGTIIVRDNGNLYPKIQIYTNEFIVENSFYILKTITDNSADIPRIEFYDKDNDIYQRIYPNTTSALINNSIFILPINNRGTMHIATQEINPANTVNINLSLGDFTPNVTDLGACYFIVVTGSVTNGIVLNSTFTDYVAYTFLNQVNNTTFKTNTGGTIYGIHTSLPAGIITIIKSGNDFYVTHP